MIRVSEFTGADVAFIEALYQDPEARRQMYPSQAGDAHDGTFVVWEDDEYTGRSERVGAFTLYEVDDGVWSFGFVVAPERRRCGYGNAIVEEVKTKARELGAIALRADIYKDNVASIRACERAGMREFVWLEMNL